jgi:outer membrane protein
MGMIMSCEIHRGLRSPVGSPRKLTLLLLGTLWCSAALHAVPMVAAQRRQMPISLQETTAIALQENLDIQIAGLNPRIREAQITEEKGIFDVEARVAVSAADARTLETSSTFQDTRRVDGLVGQDGSQQQDVSLGISQRTPYGGAYEVRTTETHLETTRSVVGNRGIEIFTGVPNTRQKRPGEKVEYYIGALDLRVTQPLLRNFGETVTKNRIIIAQNNFSISQEDFRQQVITVTSRVQQTYWELVFRRQDLEVRQQQLELAQRLLEQIRKQVAVGTLAPIEVLQAETNIARTRERILVAENAVGTADDRLKRVMNLSLSGDLADVELLPTDTPTYTAPTFEPQEQIKQALENRPDLLQARITLENQNITLVVDKNQVLPALDLEATLRFNGINDNFGGSFDEFDFQRRYGWGVGVVFRYPLANRRAKSRVQQSGLAIRQQLLRIKNLEEDIMAQVRLAARDVLTNAQRVQASRSASRLAEKQLEAEEKKLQVGLATVFTVLDFQEDLAVERSNEINALTEYLKALVRLEESKGTLLLSYNISLQSEGPRLQGR